MADDPLRSCGMDELLGQRLQPHEAWELAWEEWALLPSEDDVLASGVAAVVWLVP